MRQDLARASASLVGTREENKKVASPYDYSEKAIKNRSEPRTQKEPL